MLKKIVKVTLAFLIGGIMTLSLVACSIEQEKVEDNTTDQKEEALTETFMLKAESGYISSDNDQDAEVYIINTDSNEVYIAGKGKTYTKEDRERFESMTEEERDELIVLEEDPLFKIISLEATRDLIILEYEEDTVTFTALSSSMFETDSGIRYRLEENTSVSAYEESLRDQ